MGGPKPLNARGNTGNGNKLPRPKRKKRPKGSSGNGWALVGVATSLVLTWALAAFKIGKKRQAEVVTERSLLGRMLKQPMLITEHGACRMDCRHISKAEVLETLKKGRINQRKSNPREVPCPKYVVDANVGKSKRSVQAVFSACRDATKVVTVIDKQHDWECHCP